MRFPPFSSYTSSPRATLSHLKAWAGGIFALLLGLLAGLYLFFPTHNLGLLIGREITARTGIRVSLQEARPSFPTGLAVSRLGIQPPGQGLPPMEFQDVRLGPDWSSLLGSDPGVNFSAKVLGGALEGSFSRSGTTAARLEEAPFDLPVPQTSLRLKGRVQAGRLEARELSGKRPASELNLTLRDVSLQGTKALGATEDNLPLGQIVLEAKGQGSRIQISSLTAQGGSVEATGSGDLTLDSGARLNLSLSLRPAAGLDPALLELLGLAAPKQKDGTYRLQINSPLAL